MIKSNEIRLGNLFIGYNDKAFKWGLDDFDLIGNNVYVDEVIKSPILLTPEILAKCGFVSVGNTGTSDNWFSDELGETNLMIRIGGNGLITLYIKAKELVSLTNIIYLHQLQNLYFALTGEELTINL